MRDSRGSPSWHGSTWHLVPHIAYQQLTYPVTGISVAVTGNNYVTGIQE